MILEEGRGEWEGERGRDRERKKEREERGERKKKREGTQAGEREGERERDSVKDIPPPEIQGKVLRAPCRKGTHLTCGRCCRHQSVPGPSVCGLSVYTKHFTFTKSQESAMVRGLEAKNLDS